MENLLTIKNNEGREIPVIESREVAEMLDISQVQVSRMESKIIEQLKKKLLEK